MAKSKWKRTGKRKGTHKGYSDKQIARIKRESRMRGAKDALIISIAVMADELALTDEQIGDVARRFDRYIKYQDDDIIRMKEITDIIEKETGITFSN